jgi:hypothetical protein
MVLVFLAPYGVGVLSQARGASPALTQDQSGGVSGAVLWNGINVDTAPNVASAISWSFTTQATVQFQFVGPLTGTGVSQAFLVILFLGFPAYTKQQVESTAFGPLGGTISMTYDLTQFKWYLQGVFELHAYLENPAGTTLWSENFYVKVAQPYDLVVATVGLILLTIAELYMIATVGPRAMDKVRAAKPTKAEQEEEATETPDDTTSSPPEKS